MRLFDILVLETTGACNRTCASCHRQTLRSGDGSLPLLRTVETKIGKGPQMPRDLFERLINESSALGFEGRLWMQYYSEPLLDDRFLGLAEYARSRLPGALITTTTNADLMTAEIAAGLNEVMHHLQISLYMPPKKQAERERQLREWLPKPTLAFTDGAHALARGVDHEAMESAVAAVIDTPCFRERQYFAVAYNGDVCHCCFDANAEFGLGNVHDSTIRELWFGDAYREVVAALSRPGGRHAYKPCRECPRTSRYTPTRRIPVVPLGGRER